MSDDQRPPSVEVRAQAPGRGNRGYSGGRHRPACGAELAPQDAYISARVAQALAEGAARYCPERFEPVRTLEIAREAADNFLALSIVSSRLGRPAETRSSYDRGSAAMNETRPKSPQLITLRSEAAELLGIEP